MNLAKSSLFTEKYSSVNHSALSADHAVPVRKDDKNEVPGRHEVLARAG